MTFAEVLVAVVSALAGIAVTGVGYWTSRKLGLSEGQRALVKTLQDSVVALNERIDELEDKNTDLLGRVEHLEDENIRLANINSRLRAKLEQAGIQL